MLLSPYLIPLYLFLPARFFFFFFPFPCPFSPPFHYEIYGYVSKSMCSWITSLTHCLTEKTRLAEKGNTI